MSITDQVVRYKSIFATNLYLAAELSNIIPDSDHLATLQALATSTGVPLVAANAVHYHVPERRYLQDVLTCIRHKCTVATAGARLFANAERHLRPRDEIARRYAPHAELIARTIEIAERCTFSLDELRYEYPHELVPAGQTAMEYLEHLTWQGAAERYGVEHPEAQETAPSSPPSVAPSLRRSVASSSPSVPPSLPPKIRDLLTRELTLIRELHYEHYFLTVWDLVRFARSRGILCQGRGSAANSAVCYCLGVTAVDPQRHDLLFERFISKERNEPPDIDIDFEHERREDVFQYIYQKYGRERAAITAEVICYRPRSAVRDVGKALGLSLDRVDTLAKALDWWSRDAVPEDALRAAGFDPHDRTIQMIVRLVRQLLGFPRHLSQHVGGFVMTETPLCEIVPLENGAMPDRTFIEWDKDDIDALGILKVDCLALGMLTALQKAFGLLRTYYGIEIERSRDQEIKKEGAAAAALERMHHDTEAAVSRPDRMAEGDCVVHNDLPPDTNTAGCGEIRTDEPDAPRDSFRGEQHRRGQCPRHDPRVSEIAPGGPRLLGRTGNPTRHSDATGIAPERRQRIHPNPGSPPPPPSSDPKPPQEVSPVNAAPPSSLDLSISRSLDLFCPDLSISRSLDLSIPVPRSLIDIPEEDPRVYQMICAADTIGVFQIESRAQMSMLPRLKPRCFYDLVIEVAIVRPGPIQGGMVHPYLRRRHGLEPVTYPSDAVRSVLEKTLGVPLFQEQVMRLAVVAAGFTPGEADHLRRSMAAWRRGGQIEQFQVRLVKGMLANGYSKQFAEQIFNQIRGFGEYGFPESHAASFALLAYASAWMKRYHPAAFTAAILNSLPMGFYAPAQLVRDARQHDITVLPVDVNASRWDCTLEREPERDQEIKRSRDQDQPPCTFSYSSHKDQESPPPSLSRSLDLSISRSLLPPALRLGYRLVRGLSAEKTRGVEAAQQSGPIRSINQLARRGDISRETLLRLAAADAFRSLGLSRRQALWRILALDDAQLPLFADLEPTEPPAALPEMPLDETVIHDYDAVGLSLTAHPIELVRNELRQLRVATSEQLRQTRHGRRTAVAGIVTHRQRPSTAKGIVFMTLEDETGHANLIIRPDVWDRFQTIARSKIALIAEGHIERQDQVVHLQVRRFFDLSTRIAQITTRSRDFR